MEAHRLGPNCHVIRIGQCRHEPGCYLSDLQVLCKFGTFGYNIRGLLVDIRLDSDVYIWRLLTVTVGLVNAQQIWLDTGWLNLCKLKLYL